jgi:A/G-specific adenine glycosylase
VERHGGRVPDDLAALQALPGVGPYTARAVLAFAFEADVGVVETNSARVLARAVAGRRLSRAEAQEWADRLVPPARSWAWNSAVLDLGATVCTRVAPRCAACPVTAWCAWSDAGRRPPDPAAGSAGGGAAPFAGSDRQGRGRLVAALRRGPVAVADIADVAGWPGDHPRAARAVASLVADGLVLAAGEWLSLPESVPSPPAARH